MSRAMKIAIMLTAAAGTFTGQAQARNYTFEEIANNPFQINEQMISAHGVVKNVKFAEYSNYSLYRFDLTEPHSQRSISVRYYVVGCGQQLDQFNYGEGSAIQVLGKFRRRSMSKVTRFLGELTANEDKKEAACASQRRARRRS